MIWPTHLITYITITIGPDLIDMSSVPELMSTKFRKARETQLPQKTLQMFSISRVFFPLLWEGNIPLHMTQDGETSRN
jgi:hypothetical protein